MIECSAISKHYGKRTILKPSTFTLRSQKISFIMGPNGCGKTTLIKCLFGLENCGGSTRFDGHALNQVRQDCLVLWDDLGFYPGLSGLDNLELFCGGKRKEILAAASRYLDCKTLKDKVKHYSAGQRKKLNLILVELCQPRYLVMDEISNGLDYEFLKELQPMILAWAQRMTILLTGHQFNFYNTLADDIYLFQNQEISLHSLDNDKQDYHRLEDIYDAEIIAQRN